jgi:hypothetical protein
LSRFESRSGIIAIKGLISQRMQPGVVHETSHQTTTIAKVITSDYPVGRRIRPFVVKKLEVEWPPGRLDLLTSASRLRPFRSRQAAFGQFEPRGRSAPKPVIQPAGSAAPKRTNVLPAECR